MPTVLTLMDHSTALVNLVTQEMESRVSVSAKKSNFNISFKNIFCETWYSKSFSDHSAASYCSSFSIKEIVRHYNVFLPQGSTAEWKTWMTSLRTLAYIEHVWTTARLTAMIINKVCSYGPGEKRAEFCRTKFTGRSTRMAFTYRYRGQNCWEVFSFHISVDFCPHSLESVLYIIGLSESVFGL